MRYVIRPGRRSNDLKLKALYYLEGKEAPSAAERKFKNDTIIGYFEGITARSGAQLGSGIQDSNMNKLDDDPYRYSPYSAFGACRAASRDIAWHEWASLLHECQGLIAFDMILCPQHKGEIAVVRLAGCSMCGDCPEGAAFPGLSAEHRLPLLHPPPRHSYTLSAAQTLGREKSQYPPLIVRCKECLQGRWCERCNAWWCENCYSIPASNAAMPWSAGNIKVHNGLCVSRCLVDDLLNGVGEGGMWG